MPPPFALPPPVAPDPSAGKSAFELEFQNLWQDTGRGWELSGLIQPDFLFHRRIAFGARFATATDKPVFAGFAGYQHFHNRHFVFYGHAVLGAYSERVGEPPFTQRVSYRFYGGEVGIKLYLIRWFYLTGSIGASNLNRAWAGLGFGIAPGPVLAPLRHLR